MRVGPHREPTKDVAASAEGYCYDVFRSLFDPEPLYTFKLFVGRGQHPARDGLTA